jgi:hypothetical protein
MVNLMAQILKRGYFSGVMTRFLFNVLRHPHLHFSCRRDTKRGLTARRRRKLDIEDFARRAERRIKE